MTEIESNDETEENGSQKTQITISEFFESVPPNQTVDISDISLWRQAQSRYANTINTPEIRLHCSNESCNGTRFFRCITNQLALPLIEWVTIT